MATRLFPSLHHLHLLHLIYSKSTYIIMSFSNLFRTPLSGCSQLPITGITAAVTKGKELGAALAGSAWTWAPCSPVSS